MGTTQPTESGISPNLRQWRLRLARLIFFVTLALCLSFPAVYVVHLPRILSTGFTGLFCDSFFGCQVTDEGITPLFIVEGSPADKAAIHPEDRLAAIGGEPVTPQTYRPFSPLFQTGDPGTYGEVGAAVTVTLVNPEGESRDVRLIREPGWGLREVARWQILGFSNAGASAYILLEWLFVLIPCLAAGLFLGWRGWRNWMALLAAGVAFIIPQFTTGLPVPVPIITVLSVSNAALGWLLIPFLLLALPDGRILPRWALPLPVVSLLLYVFGQNSFVIINYLLLFVGIIGQVQRYRTASPETRQAQKWLAYSLSISVFFGLVGMFIAEFIFPAGATAASAGVILVVAEITGRIGMLADPVGLVFVSLRYRLWDIDLVINKSLVFTVVTVVLVAVFALVLVVLQALLRAVLGAEQTALAATISTGVVFLLFNPVRKRVRHFIDHRLYGLRYDLDQLVEVEHPPTIKHPGALSGKTLDEFLVLDLIGRGGMGEVYKAQVGDTTVALKLVPEELADDPQYRRRLEREAQALKLLSHPHIVRFHKAGESNGIYYIALDYLEGENLKARVDTKPKMTWEDICPWIDAIGSALEYMHVRHIIHRDIKPANIMLTFREHARQEDAVLMDFGIAKNLMGGMRLTTPGQPIGSIGYMAPEQILDSREVDHRADIYAFGVMLFELLTGESPFTGNVGQLIFAHLKQPPPDPGSLNADIPPVVSLAIMQALSKDPDDRPDSVARLLEMLKAS